MKTSSNVLWASALAAIFLVGHLAFLPPTLEDLDSMNFALGVRDFDPSKHQPHPPGYPVFIALGKLSHVVWPSDSGSLSLWGALFGALSVFPLVALFRSIEALDPTAADADRDRRAALATLVVVASPLFWFTSLRPLSDVPGLGMALAAQACLTAAFVRRRRADSANPAAIGESGRLIVAGALIAGLAVGMRTQTIWLTLPLLAAVLLDRAGRGAAGALLGSAMTFSIGVLAWAIPLLIASGGLAAYRAAFAGQAAEQFTGLDIFLSNPTPRRMALGIIASLIGPWAVAPLGWIVVAIAVVGFVLLVWRGPYAAALLLVAYVAVLDLSSHRPGIVQPVRGADRACRRLPGRPRFLRGWTESGDIRERGDCCGVAAGDVARSEGLFAVSKPCVRGNQRFAAARVERSGQCGRRASAVRARAGDRRRSRDDSAVTGHA